MTNNVPRCICEPPYQGVSCLRKSFSLSLKMLFEWHASMLMSRDFIRKENFRRINGAIYMLKVINISNLETKLEGGSH